jgi:LysM repeat protein
MGIMKRKDAKNFSGIAFGIFCLIILVFPANSFAQLTAKDTSTVQFINSRKFYIYKVSKGETLFSISQKFKIPQEEILQFNKDVEKDGLKNKMKLWVPAYSWLKKDSTATATAIDVKPQYLESYKVSILTSLQLPKVYTGQDTSGIAEPFSKELTENLEFVEGVMAGLESFKNKFKIHFYIIDTEGDSTRMLAKLKKHKDSNMIITNETGSMLKTLSQFSSSYNLKLISCGTNTFEVIRSNSNAYAMMPSSSTQCEMAGIFVSKYFHQPNVIALRTGSWKENERSDIFSDGLKKGLDKRTRKPDYAKNGVASVTDSLVVSDQNVVFIPTSNEEIVSSVLSAIKEKSGEFRVSVIGLPTWQFFETVDQKLFETCNVHLFSSGMIDYTNETITSFRKLFRDKYNCEPSDIAFQGYDAVTVINTLIQQGGVSLIPKENQPIKGIFSSYQFERSDSGSCFENKIIHVYQPLKDGYDDLFKNINFKK